MAQDIPNRNCISSISGSSITSLLSKISSFDDDDSVSASDGERSIVSFDNIDLLEAPFGQPSYAPP
jgi:hypothetical protein